MHVVGGACGVCILAIFPHRLDQSFSDAFLPEHQLIRANPKHGL